MQVSISEATTLLLAHNASVKSKNKDGWNSLMEAVSYGDRKISKFIFPSITDTLEVILGSFDYLSSRQPYFLIVLHALFLFLVIFATFSVLGLAF